MNIDDLASKDADEDLEADVVIIGGGPAGYALAREFRGSLVKVLVLESGERDEDPKFEALNAIESIGEPRSEAQLKKRRDFHGANAALWSNDRQQFGVRSRVLGGSSYVWAGKSAAFDPIDFSVRDRVPYSGWPVDAATLAPYVDRAAEALNLGPNCYDETFWSLIRERPPEPVLDPGRLRSFFWQFSRSKRDKMDFTRFGREFEALDAPNVRVLINATVTRIDTTESGAAFSGLEVSTIDGARSRVRAKIAILSAGGIENARLLLASSRLTGHPLGNQHDLVGRFLMDHPSASIGRFRLEDCKPITRRFGFYGLKHGDQTHIYLHGLALSPELQQKEGLLNCAAYMMGERAQDDPFDALKRILRSKSIAPLADLVAVLSGPGLLAKGLGMLILENRRTPAFLKNGVINGLLRLFPNFVVSEYQSRGLPHKLTGISIHGITEQRPDFESRITLSDTNDALGTPIAQADWRINEQERNSLIRLGHVLAAEFKRVGLPAPILAPWVADEQPQDGVIIDMAHTIGTTRMSDDPKRGVVDANAQVHGVENLYVAGASVFPTTGHANPTLMIMALAIRLADHIKLRFE